MLSLILSKQMLTQGNIYIFMIDRELVLLLSDLYETSPKLRDENLNRKPTFFMEKISKFSLHTFSWKRESHLKFEVQRIRKI